MKISSSGNQDLVKVYLNQMSDIPPISVDEERVLAANLETTRKELRDRILAAGIPLMRGIALLEKVHSKELPIDRALLIDVQDNAQKNAVYAQLDEHLPTLQRNLKTVQRDFGFYLSKDVPSEKRLKLRKMIRARLIESVAIMDQFNIQISRLYPMVAEVQDALRKMKSARRRYRALELRGATQAALEASDREFIAAQVEA